MVKNSYPFVKCCSPRIVTNRYTGESLITSCGVCSACVSNRCNKMTQLCSIEEQDHKYCLFVTLTYNDSYLPLLRFHYDGERRQALFFGDTPRLPEYDKIVTVSNMDYFKLSYFIDKCRLDGKISYSSKRDLQLFIKRLRKNVSKKTNERLRYYAVSEYGPKTFRVHYHLMLFFDQKDTSEIIQQAVRSCWTYGRVDTSFSRGSVASYVASYVNSRSTLPGLYSKCAASPFSLHSTHFALSFYKDKREKVYTLPLERIIHSCRVVGSRFVDVHAWRTLTSTFFPRCKGYASKSYRELFDSYTILPAARRFAASEDFTEIATTVLIELHYYVQHHYRGRYNHVLAYFAQSLSESDLNIVRCNKITQLNYYDGFRLLNQIKSELYISKHFIEFCCDVHFITPDSSSLFSRRLRDIIRFYNTVDALRLRDFYQSQSDYYSDVHNLDDDWRVFYSNSFTADDAGNNVYRSELKCFRSYKRFVASSENDLRNRVKHKKLNDLNRIFIN